MKSEPYGVLTQDIRTCTHAVKYAYTYILDSTHHAAYNWDHASSCLVSSRSMMYHVQVCHQSVEESVITDPSTRMFPVTFPVLIYYLSSVARVLARSATAMYYYHCSWPRHSRPTHPKEFNAWRHPRNKRRKLLLTFFTIFIAYNYCKCDFSWLLP